MVGGAGSKAILGVGLVMACVGFSPNVRTFPAIETLGFFLGVAEKSI